MSRTTQNDGVDPKLERRVQPRVGDSSSLPTAINLELNLELLELATAELTDIKLRERVRSLAVRMTGGFGAAQATLDSSQNWQISARERTGRVPTSNEFNDWIAKRCPEAIARATISLDRPDCTPDMAVAIVPLLQFGCAPEAFLLFVPQDADLGASIIVLQRISSVLKASLKSQVANQSTWKLNSLAALLELVSAIETTTDARAARIRIANEIARHLNCPFVAVSSVEDGKLQAMELSGARTIDRRSNTYHDFRQAIEESLLRQTPGLWPSQDDANYLLLAHRQLAAGLKCEAVLSQPLITVEGKRVGCWLFAGSKELVHSDRMQRFIAAASPRVAGALDVVGRTEHPWLVRTIGSVPKLLKKRRTIIGIGLSLAVAAILAVPMPYRVRCLCTISPTEKRFAVAPYDGTIARGFVRPGDTVEAGTVLAEMDDRMLNMELSGVSAEHLKAVRKQSIELADHNISKLQLAALEAERLAADESLLRFRQQNLQIRSPIDGVILSGSTERAEAASVRRGQVLFEIGSLQQQRIEVEIPSTEIACVKVGQPATIWVEGLEGHALEGKIERIQSQAELRNGKLVFVAEVPFVANSSQPLHPGMRGSARVDGDRHSLAWNLFRRPYELLRSYCAW